MIKTKLSQGLNLSRPRRKLWASIALMVGSLTGKGQMLPPMMPVRNLSLNLTERTGSLASHTLEPDSSVIQRTQNDPRSDFLGFRRAG